MKKINAMPSHEKAKKPDLVGQFSTLLTMFGTDVARENFLRHCRAYNSERIERERTQRVAEVSGEAPAKSSPMRSQLHNKIMETIQAISLGTKRPTKEQQEALNTFASREDVAHAIHDFVKSEHKEARNTVHDDEYEQAPSAPSSAREWHMLGKEH